MSGIRSKNLPGTKEHILENIFEEFFRSDSEYPNLVGPCWIWKKCKDKDGYGKSSLDKKDIRAHKLAFLIWGGVMLDGCPQVCHHCDNPPCVNPDHLYSGSLSENRMDAVTRGRIPSKHGENSSSALLCWEDVKEIRRLYFSKQFNQKQLAEKYGVCFQNISNITRNKSWKEEHCPI